ncbi:MAG: acetyl-CoA carboxylase biotin carboxyl carrier protein subunit [Candidatus Cloacimonetes bacterium]|nr:acetyl-CoA carboxylase biotin carboxyl carrier protein subunit [Candidatus Cloacimonadota bacterium]
MKFIHLDKTHSVEKEKRDDTFQITIDEKKKYDVSEIVIQSNLISFKANGKLYHINFAIANDKQYYSVDGENFVLEKEKSKTAKTSTQQKGNTVFSQMPGLLVKVPVSVGDKVKSGKILAIVEAMKMQNELPAPSNGIVKKINFKEGEQVDAKQVIVELEIKK